jgi:hypothetical protein
MKRHHRPLLEALETRALLATCHVTRLGDFGAGADIGGGHSRGDLRFCINSANANPGPDSILFSVTGAIQVANLPALTSEIDIQGPGVDLLAIDAGRSGRVFHVAAGGSVRISGLTMTGGAAFGATPRGAGILNEGSLVIRRSTITDNRISVPSGTAAYGGGIYNTGSLAILDSTISNNENAMAFKEVYGGGIYNSGTLTISNSTISGNTAGDEFETSFGRGGGIYNTGNLSIKNSTIANNAALEASWGGAIYTFASMPGAIRHSTISGNSAESGGGGLVVAGAGAGPAIDHTIVASNTAPPSCGSPDLCGPTSGGFNLIGGNPMLGPLQDNGGPTPTMALLPGSPAIDAGDPAIADPPTWDQRGPGFPRIVNGRLDIGAFEVQATGLVGKNAGIATPFLPSPVHGASRGGVIGPALTPGAPVSRYDPAPFTGLLGVRLEPRLAPSAQAGSSRPVNGPEHFVLLADIFRPVKAEIGAPLSDEGGIP